MAEDLHYQEEFRLEEVFRLLHRQERVWVHWVEHFRVIHRCIATR